MRSLCEQGKWAEAREAAEAAVGKARKSLDGSSENKRELAISLEAKGDYFRAVGEFEAAREDYKEAMKVLESVHGSEEDQGRISASVAVLYDEEEDTEEAKRFYERAIDMFKRMNPPANLDVADLSNNLAFIYEEMGNFDRAETLFLDALKICHEELGPKDEETAVLCNNVGALYQKGGYYEQARAMHVMALEAREETLGKNHLETGQSHSNLALTLAEMGDPDKLGAARQHFEKALDVYEKHFSEAPTDYATVVANYTQFLRNIGDEKSIAVLEKRASKVMKKG